MEIYGLALEIYVGLGLLFGGFEFYLSFLFFLHYARVAGPKPALTRSRICGFGVLFSAYGVFTVRP